jgi:SAM-dependent methyltransferase
MMAKRKSDTKELGLVVGLIFGKYFFGTEDLHYGYWPEGLEVKVENLTKAQEHHSDFIVSHIPDNVHTVLDVGCGVGRLAKRLTDKGYKVDCVSPSPYLTAKARENLGTKCRLFESTFEDLDIDGTYDLVLFSESFQYIKIPEVIEQSHKYLKPEGHMLICDFFKKDAIGKSVIGGGHRLSRFYDCISKFPFESVADIDITDRTMQNLDLVDTVMREVGRPLWDLVLDHLDSSHPFISKILKWKNKKKIDKIEKRYFSGIRNGEHFANYKTYRLLLYKKTGE